MNMSAGDYEDAVGACPWCGGKPHKPHIDRKCCIRMLANQLQALVARSSDREQSRAIDILRSAIAETGWSQNKGRRRTTMVN